MGPKFKGALTALLLLSAFAAQGPVAPIQIYRDFIFQTMTSDRFTWIDSNGNPRVAVLAHNDPAGTHRGELRELVYQVGGMRDVIASTTSGASAFGYVVSHPKDSETCLPPPLDNSSLGHLTVRGHVSSRVGTM